MEISVTEIIRIIVIMFNVMCLLLKTKDLDYSKSEFNNT